jgi:hypothetical protein
MQLGKLLAGLLSGSALHPKKTKRRNNNGHLRYWAERLDTMEHVLVLPLGVT